MDISKIKVKDKTKTSKRLGRGSGSGWGGTSGRGNKGAGQRSGKKLPYVGFNGGNIPFFRKIPKRGFNPINKKDYQIVNLQDILGKIEGEKEIDPQILKRLNLIKNDKKPVKILGNIKGDLSLKAVFKADKFSIRAKELIEQAGGKAVVILNT